MRSEEEIQAQVQKARVAAEAHGSHPWATYEQGVETALNWVLGDDMPPMEEE